MKILKFFFILLIYQSANAQIVKDLDKDGKNDFVDYDANKAQITCKLSSAGFKPIYSKAELTDEMSSGLRATKSGFELYVSHMRAGYANQFRYDENAKKMRLIGMSRYEFGPASNDGSGESSVNLLTNNYIGEWHHFDSVKTKLIKMQTIKAKMYFPKIYLNNFDGSSYAKFEADCSALYYKQKKKM